MKKSFKMPLSLLFLFALLPYHCFTSAGFFKTARSLGVDEEGKPDTAVVTGFGTGGDFAGAQPLLFLDGSLRAAILPDILEVDAGLAVSSLWSFDFSLGLKYSFIQNSDFAMALALEMVDTTNIFSAAGYSFLSLQPAVLATWTLSSELGITLAPRAYIPLGPVPLEGSSSVSAGYQGITSTFLGATVVFDIGKEFGVLPEVGVFYEFSGGTLLWHAGVGFRFG